jgi:hypothetical protein
MSEHTGGCRCGDVKYTLRADPLDVKICHCRDCQYASGGAFSVVAYFPAAASDIRGATSNYSVKGSAGMTVNRHFCGRCGSPVYSSLTELPDIVFIKTGTLDNPESAQPSGHMWCNSMLSWADLPDGLERLPENPAL